MQVVVNQLLTSYSRTGTGKTVVILHGWGDRSANWQPFAHQLSKHYDVIVPDLPGFGSTQAPKEAWGLEEYAAFLAAFLKKINAQPYALVGHSNGGAIAIRGLANGTLTADRLVLLASAGVRPERSARRGALQLLAITGKLITTPLPRATRRTLQQKLYGAIGSDALVAEHLRGSFEKVVRDDVQADAARLAVPTLLMYGQNDTATPPRHGERLHQAISGSKLVVLPRADHFLYQTHTAEVLAPVREFLA